MSEQTERATPEAIENLKSALKESNEDRKKDKLRRQIARAHDWRIRVWAESELKIRSANAALAVLGAEEVKVFEPDFTSDENLHHYANMQISK